MKKQHLYLVLACALVLCLTACGGDGCGGGGCGDGGCGGGGCGGGGCGGCGGPETCEECIARCMVEIPNATEEFCRFNACTTPTGPCGTDGSPTPTG